MNLRQLKVLRFIYLKFWAGKNLKNPEKHLI